MYHVWTTVCHETQSQPQCIIIGIVHRYSLIHISFGLFPSFLCWQWTGSSFVERNSSKYLKSYIYLLDPKVSGCQQHYEIDQSPSDIYWNLENQHFPKSRTPEVPFSWSLGLAWSLGSTHKSLLMIKGITISTTKYFRTAYFRVNFTLGLLKISIEKKWLKTQMSIIFFYTMKCVVAHFLLWSIKNMTTLIIW